MNEAFIWLSGNRFIGREICNGQQIFFRIFTENNPVRGTGKDNIPDVNWLKI